MGSSDEGGLGDKLLGLNGFRIISAETTEDELIISIETTAEAPPACPRCGTKARAQGRYPVHYRDLLSFGLPVRLKFPRPT